MDNRIFEDSRRPDLSFSWEQLFEASAPGPAKTFVIAEAGVNHNGDLALAKALIDAAARAGANAVKFQLFHPDMLAAKCAPLPSHQSDSLGRSPLKSQHELLSSLVLPLEAYVELQAHAHRQEILFLCTPFDESSALFVHTDLQSPFIKVPSGEITNLPYLEMLAHLKTPIVLSTGMSTLDEVKTAVKILRRHHQIPLAILHCTSAYPAPVETANLRATQTLKMEFPDCIIGLSDHTLSTPIAIAAVAMGARILEKPFTIDRSLPGPDHKACITVSQLEELVDAIREVDLALGDGIKQPQPVEFETMQTARKSIVVRYNLPAGHIIGPEDITLKRPGTGLPPMAIQKVIGRRITKPLQKDDLLLWDALDMPLPAGAGIPYVGREDGQALRDATTSPISHPPLQFDRGSGISKGEA